MWPHWDEEQRDPAKPSNQLLRRKFVIMNAYAKNLPFTYTTHTQAVIKF